MPVLNCLRRVRSPLAPLCILRDNTNGPDRAGGVPVSARRVSPPPDPLHMGGRPEWPAATVEPVGLQHAAPSVPTGSAPALPMRRRPHRLDDLRQQPSTPV